MTVLDDPTIKLRRIDDPDAGQDDDAEEDAMGHAGYSSQPRFAMRG